MKRILISGGPVHANLDAVKIITNRFKGGLMAELATHLLGYDTEIFYLGAPRLGITLPAAHARLTVVEHNGFTDYHQKVLELAPTMDAVILGAAVANLIPLNPYVGKFPSHNFKPGDVIPIDFTIAPRVIDDVKRVAPRTHLFGYKLLSGVSHDELIHAAYNIVLDAHATAVFANDARNLQQKYAVTKERGVHPLEQWQLAAWIWAAVNDIYFRTVEEQGVALPDDASQHVRDWIGRYSNHFVTNEAGLIFGTVAVRHRTGFVTTGRGKRELDSLAYVTRVDPDAHVIYVAGGAKATLNAPLLARLFKNPAVETIVHYHEPVPGLPTYAYALPGTCRDSDRPNETSFNIHEHGCMLLFDENGGQL